MIREVLGVIAVTGALVAILCGTAESHPFLTLGCVGFGAWGLS